MIKNVYRIYTENKNIQEIIESAKVQFDGATIYHSIGVYNKIRENGVIIEIIGSNSGRWLEDLLYPEVVRFADWIKRLNSQQSVLITRHEVEVETI